MRILFSLQLFDNGQRTRLQLGSSEIQDYMVIR